MNQTEMKIGDIVRIKGKKKYQVVISCGLYVEKAYDGDYSVYQFSTIELPEKSPVANALDSDISSKDPSVNQYYLSGYSMRGDGKEISKNDVLIIGSTELKKQVSVTYKISKVRMI